MCDTEIRIAIAELCGWSNQSSDDRLKDGTYRWDVRCDGTIFGLKPVSWEDGKPTSYLADQKVPDYPNDLNAIHEAAQDLGLHNQDNLDDRIRWSAQLRAIVGRRCPRNRLGSPVVSDIDLLTADARELAEALLRTFKKWIS